LRLLERQTQDWNAALLQWQKDFNEKELKKIGHFVKTQVIRYDRTRRFGWLGALSTSEPRPAMPQSRCDVTYHHTEDSGTKKERHIER
jgi:hypothetical protein